MNLIVLFGQFSLCELILTKYMNLDYRFLWHLVKLRKLFNSLEKKTWYYDHFCLFFLIWKRLIFLMFCLEKKRSIFRSNVIIVHDILILWISSWQGVQFEWYPLYLTLSSCNANIVIVFSRINSQVY